MMERDAFPWLAFPMIFWLGFGLNSLIVYFAQIGGPVPAWLGIWGVFCTLACMACMIHGLRLRKGR
jgi:hypothetical protein